MDKFKSEIKWGKTPHKTGNFHIKVSFYIELQDIF